MRRRRPRARATPIDLFPFLSMFLCIFGVLSFLQIVMASSTSRRVVLVGDAEHALRAPIQIFCTADGVVVIEPVDGLRPLGHGSRGPDRLAVEAVRQRRLAHRQGLIAGAGTFREQAAPMSTEEIEALFDEVREINRIARQSRHGYEEFVLFGVYPGGAEAYHQLHSVVASSAYRELQTGVEVLDSDFQMAPLEHM